jgi:DNA repair exonuclease SbcCD ATPase subunit
MVTEDMGIPTGIWLIPLILLAVIGGLYLLSRFLRSKALEELKQFRNKWRHFQSNRREVELVAQSFSADEPEPYRSRLKCLFTQLDQVNQQTDRLERQHIVLQQCASNLECRRWRTILGAPFLWYLLHKDVSRAMQELEKTQQALDAASQVERTMNRLGWDVAQQVQETLQFQSKVRQSMDFLREKDIQGEEFENATRLEEQMRAALAQIPEYFSSGEEAEVLSKADTGSIALAHQTLDSARPALARLLAQAQTWERGYTETAEKVSAMRRILDNLERTFDSLPSSLEVDPFKKQKDQLCVISQSLQATLARLEVESVTLVAQEATRIAQIAQEAGNQLKRARREVEILDSLVDGLSAGFKKLSLQLTTLGAKSIHPVVCSQSRETLNDLNRQTDQLAAAVAPGVGQKKRTPEEVSQDLALATQLNSQQKNLARHCSHIEESHQELLDLLASPELSQLGVWLQDARRLVKQVSSYAPENWGRADAIAELPSEVETLAGAAGRLVLSDQSEPIPEEGLDARLEETRQLAETFQKLQKRVENVKSRLAGMKSVEELTQGRLESAQSTLNQIASIFRNNQFLTEVAGQEVNRLLDQIQKSLDELAQFQRGAVEKKARQTAALVAKVEQSANQWLDRLNQQIRVVVRDLSASLAELDAIAPLDEAPLEQARRLVSSSLSPGVEEHPGRARFGLNEAIDELGKRSDYWQTCAAATQALQDVRDSIFPEYQEASRLREQVQTALKGATTRARRMRGAWPPSVTTSDAEIQELEKVEEQWKALKGSRARVDKLAAQLGKLSARYQNLSERIDQNAGRVAQEQLQVERLELEIHDMAQYWENLMNVYRENPVVAQEISDLLDSIDREQSDIRQEYKQRDMTYDQVLQDLKSLHNRVRHFQAALDEERALEYGGAIRSRR